MLACCVKGWVEEGEAHPEEKVDGGMLKAEGLQCSRREKKNSRCYHCSKRRYKKANCSNLHGNSAKLHAERATGQRNEHVSIPHDLDPGVIHPGKDCWYIDSGASLHTTNDKIWFDTGTLMSIEVTKIPTANGEVLEAHQASNFRINFENSFGSYELKHANMLFIERISATLTSVSAIQEKG